MKSTLVEHYLLHLKSIIKMYDEACAHKDQYNNQIPDSRAQGILTRSRGLIEKITGKNSYYTQDMLAVLEEDWSPFYKAELIIGIIEALKSELEDGYLNSLSELVRGEIFDDYLQMAEHLLDEGYKDAAAVIGGSTLEGHLRQLCLKHGIDIEIQHSDGNKRPKKASQLNQDLAKVVYSQLDQKQITTWLDLRNSAAHGKYTEYGHTQVKQFLEWLQDFITKNPA